MARITHIFILAVLVMIHTLLFAAGNEPVLACLVHDITTNQFEHFDPTFCTHIVYYEVNTDIDFETMAQRYDQVFKQWKEKNPLLKILTSIEYHSGKKEEFQSLIDQTGIHSPFIDSLIHFLNKHNLDGFNLYYNYLNPVNSSDKFNQFLEVFSRELKQNDKILTTNIASCKNIRKQNYIGRFKNIFDYIFITCGDYDTDYTAARGAGHYTANVEFITAEHVLLYLINLKFERSSLVLGIDLRAYVHSNNIDNGTRNTSSYEYYHTGYPNVCNMWNHDSNWVLNMDFTRSRMHSKFSNGTFEMDVFYTSPDNMKVKAEYVKTLKNAGVIVWPLDSDDVFNACNRTIRNQNSSVTFPITRSLKYDMDAEFSKRSTIIVSASTTSGYEVTDNNSEERDKNASGSAGSKLGFTSFAIIILTYLINF